MPGARKKKTAAKRKTPGRKVTMDPRMESAGAAAIGAFTTQLLSSGAVRVNTKVKTGKSAGFSSSVETEDGKRFSMTMTLRQKKARK
jgi:hypothetical protein